MKIKNIDFVKGLLIVFVILGHVLQGSLSENFSRYFIYSFHMPLFIGISGYLINLERLQSSTFSSVFKKYLKRVIIPWAIAIIGFMLILNFHHLAELSFKSMLGKILRSFISPYYHLWYVSAFLFWVFLSFLLVKLRLSLLNIFFISCLISSIFALFQLHLIQFENAFLSKQVEIIQHTFRPYYYFYFVLGMLLRTPLKVFNANRSGLIALALGLIDWLMFYCPQDNLEAIVNLFFNITLLYWILMLSVANKLPSSNLIEWLGKNSLAVYLWHFAPVLCIKFLMNGGDLNMFYFECFIGEIILVCCIYGLSKVGLINRIVFGNLEK